MRIEQLVGRVEGSELCVKEKIPLNFFRNVLQEWQDKDHLVIVQ